MFPRSTMLLRQGLKQVSACLKTSSTVVASTRMSNLALLFNKGGKELEACSRMSGLVGIGIGHLPEFATQSRWYSSIVSNPHDHLPSADKAQEQKQNHLNKEEVAEAQGQEHNHLNKEEIWNKLKKSGIDWSKVLSVESLFDEEKELPISETPLPDFVRTNSMFGGLMHLFVKDQAKKMVRNLVVGISDLHTAELCIESISHANIVIIGDSETTKFTKIVFIAATSEKKVENYRSLELVLREDFFRKCPLDNDMQHLLGIMRSDPLNNVYLMNNHCALVLQINKSAFYLRMYDRITILRFLQPKIATSFLHELPYNSDWRQIVVTYNHLLHQAFTWRTGYKIQPDPNFLALYMRNVSYHKMDRCYDPWTRTQMYTAEEYEDIKEASFPDYLHTLEEELFKINELE